MARGDQIYAYRQLLNLQGVYAHHGIDCGDGSVIHYRKPSEVVERTSLETFARGGKIYVVRHVEVGFSFIPDVVVERALSRLGEQKYNLLFKGLPKNKLFILKNNNHSRSVGGRDRWLPPPSNFVVELILYIINQVFLFKYIWN